MSLLRPSDASAELETLTSQLRLLSWGESKTGSMQGMGLYTYPVQVSLIREVYSVISALLWEKCSESFELMEARDDADMSWLSVHEQLWLNYRALSQRLNCVGLYLNRLVASEVFADATFSFQGRVLPLMPVADLASYFWAQNLLMKNPALIAEFHMVIQDSRRSILATMAPDVVSMRGPIPDAMEPDLVSMRPLLLATMAPDVVSSLSAFVEAMAAADNSVARVSGESIYECQVLQPFLQHLQSACRLNSTKYGKDSFVNFLKFTSWFIRAEQNCCEQVFLEHGQAGYNTTLEVNKMVSNLVVKTNFPLYYERLPELLKLHDIDSMKMLVQQLRFAQSTLEECVLPQVVPVFEELMMAEGKAVSDLIVQRPAGTDARVQMSTEAAAVAPRPVEAGARAQQSTDANVMVQRPAETFAALLDFLGRVELYLKEVFTDEPDFAEAAARVARRIVNAVKPRRFSLGLLFARHIDQHLTDCYDHTSDLADHYGKLLATRLLYYPSVDFEAELCLTAVIPPEFSARFRRMISDVHMGRKAGSKLAGFECDVLTNLSWPLPNDLEPFSKEDLPEEMQRAVSEYERVYLADHMYRRLRWPCQLSRVTLDYFAPSGKVYELNLSFPQAMLLLHLGKSGTAQFGQLSGLLKLSRKDVYRQIKSLAAIRLVVWETPIKTYLEALDSVAIQLNTSFDNAKERIRFTPVSLDGVADELELRSESPPPAEANMLGDGRAVDMTEQDKHVLQCIVVKLAKQHKALSAAHLCQLVMQAWVRPGCLTASLIGECLKQLQSKDYLEYDEAHALYRYLP